jgi:GTPase involved in cell partitioning and DNA repair
LANIVYIGCVTEGSFPEDKATRFLNDLRSEFSKMYQGRLSLIKKQTNLTANVYDQPFKKSFQKVLDNYSSGISNKNLQMAFQKVDEVKDIAAKSVHQMVQNNAETEKLLQSSQNTVLLANDFKKNSETLEKTMENQNFWMCSRKCLMIFGGIGGLAVLIWILIKIFS